MKRAASLLAISLIVVSCATVHERGRGLTTRAVGAVGGADKLAGIRTISVKLTEKYWEPEQSSAPGGEMRFANETTSEGFHDVGSGGVRIDRVRGFEYPAPRTFTFTEIVTRDAGYVAEIDSNGRNKQSLDSQPRPTRCRDYAWPPPSVSSGASRHCSCWTCTRTPIGSRGSAT